MNDQDNHKTDNGAKYDDQPNEVSSVNENRSGALDNSKMAHTANRTEDLHSSSQLSAREDSELSARYLRIQRKEADSMAMRNLNSAKSNSRRKIMSRREKEAMLFESSTPNREVREEGKEELYSERLETTQDQVNPLPHDVTLTRHQSRVGAQSVQRRAFGLRVDDFQRRGSGSGIVSYLRSSMIGTRNSTSHRDLPVAVLVDENDEEPNKDSFVIVDAVKVGGCCWYRKSMIVIMLISLFTLIAVIALIAVSLPKTTEKESRYKMERNMLKKFYLLTNGDGWINNTNWKTYIDCCDWFGVVCDQEGNITSLNLTNNNLIGDLNSSIDSLLNLTFLQEIDLSVNKLNGNLTEISYRLAKNNNSDLESVNLINNSFTGVLHEVTFCNGTKSKDNKVGELTIEADCRHFCREDRCECVDKSDWGKEPHEKCSLYGEFAELIKIPTEIMCSASEIAQKNCCEFFKFYSSQLCL